MKEDVWTGVVLAGTVPAFGDLTITSISELFTPPWRPCRARRHPGIRYEEFEVKSIRIGGTEQWKPSSAGDLFSNFVTPMDEVMPVFNVTLVVHNTCFEKLPFAVSLEGKIVR